MRPLLCYLKHNFCSYVVSGHDVILCARCGTILHIDEIHGEFETQNASYN